MLYKELNIVITFIDIKIDSFVNNYNINNILYFINTNFLCRKYNKR